MERRSLIWPFIKSMLAGSLIGAAPVMMLTTFLGVMIISDDSDKIMSVLNFALLPLMITTPIVLTGMTLIGLPAFLILRSRRRETYGNYMIIAVIAGAAIPLIAQTVIGATELGYMSAIGMLAAGATAHTWWKSAREPELGPLGNRATETVIDERPPLDLPRDDSGDRAVRNGVIEP